MRTSLSFVGALALTSAVALAQQVIAPINSVTADVGSSANIWRLGPNRVQCIYDTTHFTNQGLLAPILINSIDWRLNGGLQTVLVNYPAVSIYVQSAAVDHATPNTQFDLNRTVNPPVANFTGPVNTVAVSGGTPNDYFISIPLTTPFAYDPSAGADLLVEIEITTAPTPATGNTISTGSNVAAHLCNSVRSVGSTTALTGALSAFCPVARFNYTNVPGAAINTPIGTGCVKLFTSVYEEFALPANVDLNGQAITMVPVGSAYLVTLAGGLLPVGPGATTLALPDDGELVQALTVGSFPGPNGPWAALNIVSNGIISDATHPAAIAGGGAPDPAVFLNAAAPAFGILGDWDPSAATGGGTVTYEESASVISITWTNVPNWTATPPAAGVNTFQIQLYPSGAVTMAIGNLASFGNNDGVAILYSPGGTSEDPGNTDLSAVGAGLLLDPIDQRGLTLRGVTRPVINTNWSVETSEIPATTVFGIDIFGLSDPGVNDLFFIGMPKCGLRASLDFTSPIWLPAPTHTYGFLLPNNPTLVGLNFYTTSAVFQSPPQNAFGAITSNGIEGRIGSI